MAKTDGKPASVKPAELRQMVAPAGVKSIITRQTIINRQTHHKPTPVITKQTVITRLPGVIKPEML